MILMKTNHKIKNTLISQNPKVVLWDSADMGKRFALTLWGLACCFYYDSKMSIIST